MWKFIQFIKLILNIYPFVISSKQKLSKYEPQINTNQIRGEKKGNLFEVFTTHVKKKFDLGYGETLTCPTMV